MPPKIRELIANLERAGSSPRWQRQYRDFVHPTVTKPVVLSGNLGDDAKQYQVRAVQLAIEESRK